MRSRASRRVPDGDHADAAVLLHRHPRPRARLPARDRSEDPSDSRLGLAFLHAGDAFDDAFDPAKLAYGTGGELLLELMAGDSWSVARRARCRLRRARWSCVAGGRAFRASSRSLDATRRSGRRERASERISRKPRPAHRANRPIARRPLPPARLLRDEPAPQHLVRRMQNRSRRRDTDTRPAIRSR